MQRLARIKKDHTFRVHALASALVSTMAMAALLAPGYKPRWYPKLLIFTTRLKQR